jgi:hypothetical protein
VDRLAGINVDDPVDRRVLAMLWEPVDGKGRHPGERHVDAIAIALIAGRTCSFQQFDATLARLTAQGLIRQEAGGLLRATDLGRRWLEREQAAVHRGPSRAVSIAA